MLTGVGFGVGRKSGRKSRQELSVHGWRKDLLKWKL